jgi:hypothetical protein
MKTVRFALAAVIVLSAREVQACSCAFYLTPYESLASAEVAFVGTVVNSTEHGMGRNLTPLESESIWLFAESIQAGARSR